MNKKERLEAIIKHYSDGKPSVFAKLIGVAPSTISSWLSRDTLDYDLLFAKCENISSEWLLTGRGEMINIQTSTFNNQTTLPQKEGTGIEDKLLAIIADKDATIREGCSNKQLHNLNRTSRGVFRMQAILQLPMPSKTCFTGQRG